MVKRGAYFGVDGHRGVGSAVLEDVELAERVKESGLGIWFRYAPDALSTHMYFGFSDMMEGWTKNLALLSACFGAGGLETAGYFAVVATYVVDSFVVFALVAEGGDCADLGADLGAVLSARCEIKL